MTPPTWSSDAVTQQILDKISPGWRFPQALASFMPENGPTSEKKRTAARSSPRRASANEEDERRSVPTYSAEIGTSRRATGSALTTGGNGERWHATRRGSR